MVIKTSFTILMFVSSSLWAQKSVPTAKSWSASEEFTPTARKAWAHRVAFIESFSEGDAEFLDLDRAEFEKDTFFELVEKKEVSYYEKLNKSENMGSLVAPKDVQAYFALVFERTKADTVVYKDPQTGRWTFYSRSASGQAKREFAAKAPDSDSPNELKAWLVSKLGYSGFVIDKKGKYVLVASFNKVDTKKNALYIGNSEGRFRITEGRAKFGGLLRYVNSHDNICVYEVVLKGNQGIKEASKILQ